MIGQTEEATTWGYSEDGERWCTGYTSIEEAVSEGAIDIGGQKDVPFVVMTARCTPSALTYEVDAHDLAAALLNPELSDNPADHLVQRFIDRNVEADIDGDLFTGLEADDALRAAIVPGITPEQATEAMGEWLEHRAWLPGARPIDVSEAENHIILRVPDEEQ